MSQIDIPEKPTTIEEYGEWLSAKHNVQISKIVQTHYETSTAKIKRDLEKSTFWQTLQAYLREVKDEYLLATGGYNLFQTDNPPEILIKPFESLLDKSFRLNVLRNEKWPNESEGGWILPVNWMTRINDILRTSLVVKYLDGVEFLVRKIDSLCSDSGWKCGVSYEAREEGYYAAHIYITQNFEVTNMNWETESTNIKIEIQVTTQLQELIRALTHRFYEATRSKPRQKEIKWQWNFRSEEFVPYYLGHILHYVEGMIMEIREKQRGKS